MRDTKTITAYAQKMLREAKQKLMFKHLRTEAVSYTHLTLPTIYSV